MEDGSTQGSQCILSFPDYSCSSWSGSYDPRLTHFVWFSTFPDSSRHEKKDTNNIQPSMLPSAVETLADSKKNQNDVQKLFMRLWKQKSVSIPFSDNTHLYFTCKWLLKPGFYPKMSKLLLRVCCAAISKVV